MPGGFLLSPLVLGETIAAQGIGGLDEVQNRQFLAAAHALSF